MKISIIIPVYNVAKYLSRCLDSVLSIQNIDWECILIDDGSTDQSWNIICQYAQSSERFIIRHQENGGVSSARNAGLEVCTGDRVMFMDPDDYFFPEAGQLLHQAINFYRNYDMILFRWADVFLDGTKKIFEIPMTDFNSQTDWIRKTVLFSSTMAPCWSKLFKRSIIDENMILFDTSMRVAEDQCFVIEYLSCADSIAVVGEEPLYAYCRNRGSAMQSFHKNDIEDMLCACRKKMELAERKNILFSHQDKEKMYNNFYYDIHRYIYGAAEYYSLKEFKNAMTKLAEEIIFAKIISNCGINSETFKNMFSKLLISNNFFQLYWYVSALNRYIKKIVEKKNQYNEE